MPMMPRGGKTLHIIPYSCASKLPMMQTNKSKLLERNKASSFTPKNVAELAEFAQQSALQTPQRVQRVQRVQTTLF
jgi:hypothetical protein